MDAHDTGSKASCRSIEESNVARERIDFVGGSIQDILRTPCWNAVPDDVLDASPIWKYPSMPSPENSDQESEQ
jgi:hypothetical protein